MDKQTSKAKTKPYRDLGLHLKTLRLEKGRRVGTAITQRDVAGAVKRAEGTVTAWETGVQRPDEAVLPDLAAYLDISVDHLRKLMGDGGGSEERDALNIDEFMRQLERIEQRDYESERDRTLARESLAATFRAIASVQAEVYRQKEADASQQRALAATEDAKARGKAEERALLTCRATTNDGRKGSDPRERTEEAGTSGP